MNLARIALSALALVAWAACSSRPSTVQELYFNGLNEVFQGKQEAAQSKLEESCQRHERAACVWLGRIQAGRGQANLAKRFYTKACELDSPVGCREQGALAMRQGNYVEARDPLETACRQARDVPACMRLGQLEIAESHAAEGLALLDSTCAQPAESGACAMAGSIRLKSADLGGAERSLVRACENGSAQGCADLGILYSWRGDLARAQPALATGCAAGLPSACRRLSSIKLSATERAAQATECQSGKAAACDGLAVTQSLLPDGAVRADSLFRQACSQGSGAACWELAWAIEAGPRPGDRAAYVKLRDVACAKKYGFACYRRGEDLRTGGSIAAAERAYDSACALGEGWGCIERGELDYWRGSLATARRAFGTACRLGRLSGCELAGRSAEEQGKIKDAQAFYRFGCSKGLGTACEALGRTYGLQAQNAEAQKSYALACAQHSRPSCYWVQRLSDPDKKFSATQAATAPYEALCAAGVATACAEVAGRHARAGALSPAQSFFLSGCNLGNGSACASLAQVLEAQHKDLEARAAWRKSCDLDSVYGCAKVRRN